MVRTDHTKFLLSIDMKSDIECWDWLGYKNKDGYGIVYMNGLLQRAHRVAYAYAHGSIPAGTIICHTCDNPGCVNPSHLYAGTNRTNQRDKKLSGMGWSSEARARMAELKKTRRKIKFGENHV